MIRRLDDRLLQKSISSEPPFAPVHDVFRSTLADKGKCLVVMDTEEYIKKMEEKLSDETTYKRIEKDQTYEIKTEISAHLNKRKDDGEIDNKTFFRLFPTKTRIPRMYGQPKIHKKNNPLREIVESMSCVAKE